MMFLNHDETNLLCIYRKKTRTATIYTIEEMQQYLEEDEDELREMSAGLLAKLHQMTDEEFDGLELFPDFDY